MEYGDISEPKLAVRKQGGRLSESRAARSWRPTPSFANEGPIQVPKGLLKILRYFSKYLVAFLHQYRDFFLLIHFGQPRDAQPGSIGLTKDKIGVSSFSSFSSFPCWANFSSSWHPKYSIGVRLSESRETEATFK